MVTSMLNKPEATGMWASLKNCPAVIVWRPYKKAGVALFTTLICSIFISFIPPIRLEAHPVINGACVHQHFSKLSSIIRIAPQPDPIRGLAAFLFRLTQILFFDIIQIQMASALPSIEGEQEKLSENIFDGFSNSFKAQLFKSANFVNKAFCVNKPKL